MYRNISEEFTEARSAGFKEEVFELTSRDVANLTNKQAEGEKCEGRLCLKVFKARQAH